MHDGTHYDAIVVGTGPGGATVARELARASKRVLILEWGERRPVTGSLGQALRELYTPGKSLLLTHGPLAVVRGITVGGSSLYYCGTAFEPPHEMLERHGIDIRDEVAEARSELPIAPFPAELIGPKARLVMESARSLGLDWKPLEKFFYQDRCKSWEAMGFYCAPAYDAKWNARMWVDEAVACGAVLQTRAKVRKVVTEGKTATGVEYEAGGSTRRVQAEKIIVGAGGIGSPTILRASGIHGAGRDFFFDPLIFVLGAVEGQGGPPEIPMSAGVHCPDDGYMMTDFSVPRIFHLGLTAQAGKLGLLGAHSRTLGIMVKAKDSLGGHLTDRGGVRKRLAPEDAAKLHHGYERARSILAEAGARSVTRTATVAAHPGGTVKVGELLDADFQTELANLYVCDCSVIPEAWGLPPTLTLIGCGKRLARHLLGAAGAPAATATASAAARG